MRSALLLLTLLVGLSCPAWAAMISVDRTSGWVGTYFTVTLNAVKWRDDSQLGAGAIKEVSEAIANSSGAYIFPTFGPGSLSIASDVVNDKGDTRILTLYDNGHCSTDITADYGSLPSESITIRVYNLGLQCGTPAPILIGTPVTFTAKLDPSGGPMPTSATPNPVPGGAPLSSGVSWSADVTSSGGLTADSSWGTAAEDAGEKFVSVQSDEGTAFAFQHPIVYAIVGLTFESGSDFMEVSMPFSIKAHFYPMGPPTGQPIWSLSPATGSALTSPADGLETVTLSPDKPGQYILTATCGTSSQIITNISYRIEWDRLKNHCSMEIPATGSSDDRQPAYGNSTVTPAVPGNPTDWDFHENELQGRTQFIAIEMNSKGSKAFDDWTDFVQPSGEKEYLVYINLGAASCNIDISITAVLDAFVTPGLHSPIAPPGTAGFHGNAHAIVNQGATAIPGATPGPPIPTLKYEARSTGDFFGSTTDGTSFSISGATDRQLLCKVGAHADGKDSKASLATLRANITATIDVSKAP